MPFFLRGSNCLVEAKPNEPVEKVTFLKSAFSARSKIEIYFLSSKVFMILGATPKSLTKIETILILYYDCLTLRAFEGRQEGT